jgi:hypothetical protein
MNMTYTEWFKSLNKETKRGYKSMYPNLTYQQMYNRMIDRFGLILPPPKFLSPIQCRKFKKNPSVNPITGRKLKKDSKTYKEILAIYDRSKSEKV